MEGEPMSEEIHRITITIQDVDVNLRTNGDGYEYSRIKDNLKLLIRTGLDIASATLITNYGIITLDDERIA